jgi:hypothetical protein
MLERLAFCCDGKEEKEGDKRDEQKEGELMIREKARGSLKYN